MGLVQSNFRFIGWSFVSDPNILYDGDLIKEDIMNEFETPKGSLDYDPSFGSIIDELVMDLQTGENELAIKEEIQRILTRDIRINILKLNVYKLPHMYYADVSIRFGDVKVVSFRLEFDRKNGIIGE